jgi:cell division transport system permease protein
VNAWLRQHAQALARAARKLAAQRMSSLLNALVIGVALSLPVAGYALVSNLQSVSTRFTLEPQVSAFLKPEAKPEEAEALGRSLRKDPRIAEVRFVSRDEALKGMQRIEGISEVVGALERNPLPDAFVLRIREAAPAVLEKLAADLRAIPAVAHVQTDSEWARRLAALASIARLAILLLAALLSAGLLAVTFNSIRLQILTQREEIEVSRLLGATDGFIRRPFYYLGALQGLAGGLLALGLVAGSFALLNQGVRQLAATYGSSFELGFLAPGDAIAVACFAVFLGWLGANLSVSIYLQENP